MAAKAGRVSGPGCQSIPSVCCTSRSGTTWKSESLAGNSEPNAISPACSRSRQFVSPASDLSECGKFT